MSKKKPPNNTKSEVFVFRLSPEDREMLRQLAGPASQSAYLCDLIRQAYAERGDHGK